MMGGNRPFNICRLSNEEVCEKSAAAIAVAVAVFVLFVIVVLESAVDAAE